jgi:ubiquinone/menaquinone biosynthesis C-methylase UbiE
MHCSMSDLRDYFEELAQSWDDLQPAHRGEVLSRLLTPFESLLSSSQAILEVGTGTGALRIPLQQRAPHASIVSIDLAGAMLERARRRCPTAMLVQADVHYLPFRFAPAPHSGFDLVVCHNSFPHFADKPAALAELARILRPGGSLLILHDLSREEVNAIHGQGGEAIRNDLLPPGAETGRMLNEAGLTHVKLEDTRKVYIVSGRLHNT